FELYCAKPRPSQISDFDSTFEIENAGAFQRDAVADQPANDLSAASRGLEGAKRSLAQALGPIWRQHAVRGASHGIFRNAFSRCEVAANEVVGSLSRRGHVHS